MSHAATHWALQQRGLKPTTKIVLWHLCDRFNPDFGCFPTQARLADDAELSVSSLNEHLAKLEEAGLIRRLRCHDPRTHRRQATRYILGFEPGFLPEPTPESGHGAISGISPEPSPDFAESHLRNPETNLVREPVRKPVKEEEGARARDDLDDELFRSLLLALGFDPDGPLPGWWQGWPPREHVRRWRDDLGLTTAEILNAAGASRLEHPEPPDGPKALDRIVQRVAQRKAVEASPKRRKPKASSPEPSHRQITDVPAFYADLVNSDRYLPVSAITNSTRDAMLARGLVTAERLRERGIQ